MPNQLAITLHASGAETANGTGSSFDLGDRTLLQLTLDVTSLSGTSPTIAVVLEHSRTGSDWATVGLFPTCIAAGAHRLNVPDVLRFVRAKWTITGTASPSLTFAVTGLAHQLYCLPADIGRYGLPASVYANVPTAVLADFCLAASTEVAGYLASAYTLPMVAWDDDLRDKTTQVAVLKLMRFRGYAPDSGKDDTIQMARDEAVKWLNRIADGKLRPPGMLDSTPTVTEVEVYVDSAASRGWRTG